MARNIGPSSLQIGDLVVQRSTKKAFIVLEVEPYRRVGYGSHPAQRQRRLRFLVVSPTGKQTWKVDTSLKVEFYLPGDSWFDDIR